MEEDSFGSRFTSVQNEGNNEGLIKLVLAVFIMLGVIFWIVQDIEIPAESEFTEHEFYEEIESKIPDEDNLITDAPDIEIVEVKEELQTMEVYYKRAIQRDGDKDYKGAVKDYEQTILMAKKYSTEMWNSLNNAGIIKAQQFKDYKGALKYFNKIISIETNRNDGAINSTRLEAGYTNRAYVKKQQGNIEGACDDLYEALSLGLEESSAFIEKQIDKNCL
jgi:tetratricopeptide (TPR) repeat protein